jgi:hypothetical protein
MADIVWRQPTCVTSQPANGAIVIGATPMPADTSAIARPRRFSNETLVAAMMGAKKAQQCDPSEHDPARSVSVAEGAPAETRDAHAQEGERHRRRDPGSRPASVRAHRVEEHGEREHDSDRDARHQRPRRDERPVAIGRKKW